MRTLVAVAAMAVLWGGEAAEAAWPTKPVTLIVPAAPGASPDIIARLLAEKLKATLGQPVVVVNRSNAQIGVTEVKDARPDGHTIGYHNSAYLTLTPLASDASYSGPGDLSTIAAVARGHLTLAVRADAPWKTVPELVAAARATPGKIRVAGSFIGGSTDHINFVELVDVAGPGLVYVPFPGGGPAFTAFLGGHVEAVTVTPGVVKPHVAAGKARVLGVYAEKRIAVLPDVPTFREQGLDVTRGFRGVVFGPKGLPADIKTALQDAVKKATADPEMIAKLESLGFESSYTGTEEVTRQLAAEYERQKVLVDKFGLRPKK